jgi:hypothetical protein
MHFINGSSQHLGKSRIHAQVPPVGGGHAVTDGRMVEKGFKGFIRLAKGYFRLSIEDLVQPVGNLTSQTCLTCRHTSREIASFESREYLIELFNV